MSSQSWSFGGSSHTATRHMRLCAWRLFTSTCTVANSGATSGGQSGRRGIEDRRDESLPADAGADRSECRNYLRHGYGTNRCPASLHSAASPASTTRRGASCSHPVRSRSTASTGSKAGGAGRGSGGHGSRSGGSGAGAEAPVLRHDGGDSAAVERISCAKPRDEAL